jgi:hypothetical protein
VSVVATQREQGRYAWGTLSSDDRGPLLPTECSALKPFAPTAVVHFGTVGAFRDGRFAPPAGVTLRRRGERRA